MKLAMRVFAIVLFAAAFAAAESDDVCETMLETFRSIGMSCSAGSCSGLHDENATFTGMVEIAEVQHNTAVLKQQPYVVNVMFKVP